MYDHALAVLSDADFWQLPITKRLQASGNDNSKRQALTAPLLYYLIVESHKLGGRILDQFWHRLGSCHPGLAENIEVLRHTPFDSSAPSESLTILFKEVDLEETDFNPVLQIAAEFFAHLGVAITNPRGRKSASGTPFSVSNIGSKETDELLQMLPAENFGARKQGLLKGLSFKRDGMSCPVSHVPFRGPRNALGPKPILAHIIPNSVHGKPDTIKCIAMFAGDATSDLVAQHINSIGNAMNLERNTHDAYDSLEWGIEAKAENGQTRYIYRRIPHADVSSPWPITKVDGDEVLFGGGPDGTKLGKGPLPSLCNLQLAVARVLKMSGAADVILQWRDEADDGDIPHTYIASEGFFSILDARLLLTGRALVI